MKKIAIAFLFLLLLTGCINKDNQEDKIKAEPKIYSFNFVLDKDVSEDEQEMFMEAIKKRVKLYGHEESQVQMVSNKEFKVEMSALRNVIFLEDEFVQFMISTVTFEIALRELPENLKITEAEQQQIEDYNNGARIKAEGILAQALAVQEPFADLAKQYSEDPGSRDNGGAYKGVKKGMFVKGYEDVIFNKIEVGEIYGQLVETEFGYHIIKKDAEQGEGNDRQIDTSHILINKITEERVLSLREWLGTRLSGIYIKEVSIIEREEVEAEEGEAEEILPAFKIVFNEEGKQLLAEFSEANLSREMAVFIDGVGLNILTIEQVLNEGELIVEVNYTEEQMTTIAQRLNSGAVNSRIRLAE